MANILITNDDGPFSTGLRLLYEAVSPIAHTYIIVPETPKSASGLGLTLHKPLRINELKLFGTRMLTVNGTPSDIIYLALSNIAKSIDLVVSGVNIGDNTSIQVILSSGTVGAAAQAALEGIPAIAFSASISDPVALEDNPRLRESIKTGIRKVVARVLCRGFPREADVLNINFPDVPSHEFVPAPPARARYTNVVERRRDPRGLEYYWLYGEPVEPEKNTDVYVVHVEKKIAVTPLKFNLTPPDMKEIVELADELNRYKS